MKLACNYCVEAHQLVREGRIDVDYFKLPGLGFQLELLHDLKAFEDFAAQVCRPILLHGLYPWLNPGTQSLQGYDFTHMDQLIRLSKTPGLSFHPGTITSRNHINTAIENLRLLRERYRSMEFVSVENSAEGEDEIPEDIAEIARESGCDFLLDISHAWCAARHYNEDLWAYLAKLPLERVHEIHINGWAEKDGATMCHVKTNEEGYEILARLLQRCQPNIITIEYGREDDRLNIGCPLLKPNKFNERAAEEIAEQVCHIRTIIDQNGGTQP